MASGNPPGKRDVPEGFAGRLVEWAGAYLISFVGLLHLLEAGEHLGYAAYLGILFLLNFAASAVAAVGIVWTGRNWAWLFGVAVAGGAFVALLWSRLVGVPGFSFGVGQWFNFLAWMAVLFELSFLAVASLALTPRVRALVGMEQRRIDRERLPPARQETTEHFDLIEDEMWEIRHRMSRDVQDLQAHLRPRALREQTQRNVRGRLDGFIDRFCRKK